MIIMKEGNILEDPIIFLGFMIGWLGGTLIVLMIRGWWIKKRMKHEY